MKVCVISTPVFTIPVAGYSGLEHLAWQHAEGLSRLGHEVSLVAPDGSSCPNVQMITCGQAGTWNEKSFYQKYWKVLPDFDVIIDHTWNKFSYMLKMEGRLKAPILGVCHAPINTMYGSLPPVEKPSFVCISQDQANHFEALFSRPARVAHNGIDTNFYRPMPNVQRGNAFLFLARFSSIKGPDIALKACFDTNSDLVLVGDKQITNEPEYFKQCEAMCDGKHRIMVGNASRGECVYYFSRAHCLLHPNMRFREPFGLAPVESMACGNPVIAWNYGAMRETIKHGETGWLVNSVDDYVEAVRNCQITDSMRRNCIEWANNFTAEKMIKRYEDLCTEAVDTGGW